MLQRCIKTQVKGLTFISKDIITAQVQEIIPAYKCVCVCVCVARVCRNDSYDVYFI